MSKSANDEILEALFEQHDGHLASFEVAGQLYAFRAPTQAEYDAAHARITKAGVGDVLGPIHRETAQKTLVHPAGDAGLEKLRALFSRQPLAATKMWKALEQLCGSDVECTMLEGRCTVEIGSESYAFNALELDDVEDCQARITKAASTTGLVGPETRAMAMRALDSGCSKESLKEALSKYPAAAARISDALARLGGADIEITVKKG